MSESVDFIVVGGGIAGVTLQLELTARGFRSMLIHTADRNVSTRIAAGIINPVAGKFFTLSWRAEEFFPALAEYYTEMEELLDASFFHPKPIYRVLNTAGEQNIWLSKANQERYNDFCDYVDEELPFTRSSFGMLEIKQGGHLDTNAFLDAALDYLAEMSKVRDEQFDYLHLNIDARTYKDVSFDKLIFCEGYDMTHNPFFKNLPFSPNKGEVLEIETEDLDPERIMVGGVFVLPYGGNRYKVGASYDHHDLTLDPTEKGRSYLVDKLENILDIEYSITEHRVGLRPAVKDRRPLLGKHSGFNWMYVYNGLGSKGVSSAPVLSKEMADFIISGKPLHPECDIDRF